MKKFVVALCLVTTSATATPIDDEFKAKCPGLFGTAKQCQCVMDAVIPVMPNPTERTVYYINILKLDNWSRLQALPDKDGYFGRVRQAQSRLIAKPCDP